MSGGHWDYNQYKLREILEEVGNDEKMKERFPALALIYRKLASVLEEAMHDLDWDFSADSRIESDKQFEENTIKKLQKIVGAAKEKAALLQKLRAIEKEIEEIE